MKTIELTDEQWDALQSGEDVVIKGKKKAWEPEGGEWFVSNLGEVKEWPSLHSCAVFGGERKTKEQAEKACAAMRIHNRLLAYRDEFDPGYEPAWNDPDDVKCCIFYDHDKEVYLYSIYFGYDIQGAVFMSEPYAKALVKKLNSGEVVL
jgi:hypothetical protein